MRKFLSLMLILGIVVNTAEALLPPLYEGVAQIKSILDNKQLDQYLSSGDVIERIERNEAGYLIVTNHHRVQALVYYKPQNNPGPARYEIKFREAD